MKALTIITTAGILIAAAFTFALLPHTVARADGDEPPPFRP
jgi:hypothetical protein